MYAGILGILFFALGFPLGIALALYIRRRRRPDLYATGLSMDLPLGFLYESFRLKYYYWESIILLEKLALVAASTLLQSFSAATQVKP